MGTGFSIHVITENLKFSAAHFIAYAPFAFLSIAAPLLVLAVTYRRPPPPKTA